MRKIFLLISVSFLSFGIMCFAQEDAADTAYQSGKLVESFPFYVYKDGEYSGNNYYPTGKMGDFKDFKMDAYYREKPFSGETCIKIVYKNSDSKKAGWAGMFWLDPQNNWGDKYGGYDLRGADKLTFWARGEKGGEKISVFQVGGIIGKYRDVGTRSLGPIILSREWGQYAISLQGLNKKLIVYEGEPYWALGGEPLSRIIGGFSWVANMTGDEDIIFYLDEIKYEKINSGMREKTIFKKNK